ncbi:diguanylate cyclase, putative, partial [Oceanicola granulosus HTCC2516]
MWREDWALAPVDEDAPRAAPDALATEIMNIMEQGILVWSADGVCELHNSRVYEVLGLEPGDLVIGTPRAEFRDLLAARGALSPVCRDTADAAIAADRPYSFDMPTPSGGVVLTSGRPARNGGYVVTFTDVTAARTAARDVEAARASAEAAEARARDALDGDRARQEEARQLSLLDEWLQSCKTLRELYMIVTRFLCRVLAHTSGELYVFSPHRDVLDGVGAWSGAELQRHIATDSCWALRRGRAYEYDPAGICFVCGHVDHPEDEDYPGKYVCVPISAHGDTVGLLHVRFDPEAYGDARQKRAATFTLRCAEHISLAVANVRLRDELHEQSIRDPLTGLHNRRHLLDRMRRELSEADRRGAPFGLVTFDADRFKAVNDTYGHDAGDAVLLALAAVMGEVLEEGWTGCRIGVEEFALLVPGADVAAAAAAGERLRARVEAMEVRHAGAVLPPVTVSVGVAVYPDHGRDAAALLKRSDEALYAAKEGGRNRVAISATPGPPPAAA